METSSAPPAKTEARREPRIQTVDFSRPSKFTKEQERQLRLGHEAFCRTVAARLSSELRAPLDLEVMGLKQLAWTTALSEIPADSLCAVVGIRPFERAMLLTADRGFLLMLIERLLGGGLDEPSDRKLTDIDIALARQLVGKLLEQLVIVWQEFGDVELDFVRFEPEPAGAQIAPLSEPTMVIAVEARIGGSSFSLTLLLPYRCIEPIAGRLTGEDHLDGADERSARLMQAALGDSMIELRAEVAAVELPAEDVLALRVGDVLRLDAREPSTVTLFAGDLPVHRARPGRSARRRAVQVLGRADEATP